MNQNSNNLKNDQANDEFYKELDKKTVSKSNCSCQTLTIFFIILAIIVSASIFYIYWQITHGIDLSLSRGHVASLNDLNNKLQNPTLSSDKATLILTDNELNTVLNDGLSINDFVLKDIVLSINPKEILIYGNLIKPLNSKVVITATAQVESGKVKINVTNTQAGKLKLPAFINKKITSGITSVMDQKMANFYKDYNVSQVILDQNKMTIVGQKK